MDLHLATCLLGLLVLELHYRNRRTGTSRLQDPNNLKANNRHHACRAQAAPPLSLSLVPPVLLNSRVARLSKNRAAAGWCG